MQTVQPSVELILAAAPRNIGPRARRLTAALRDGGFGITLAVLGEEGGQRLGLRRLERGVAEGGLRTASGRVSIAKVRASALSAMGPRIWPSAARDPSPRPRGRRRSRRGSRPPAPLRRAACRPAIRVRATIHAPLRPRANAETPTECRRGGAPHRCRSHPRSSRAPDRCATDRTRRARAAGHGPDADPRAGPAHAWRPASPEPPTACWPSAGSSPSVRTRTTGPARSNGDRSGIAAAHRPNRADRAPPAGRRASARSRRPAVRAARIP